MPASTDVTKTGSLNSEITLLQEVFSKIPSAIVVIDDHGIIKKANEAALSLLGESQLEGRRWVEVITRVFRPRNDDGHEISTRDGRRLQVATLPLSHWQLVQMTDLTETRLLQDKLAHMERLSSLGRMAASLAHQIRTPLSAAMLYASNLGNSHLSPDAHQRFQEKLVNRLQALEAQVSDILMFARSNEQTVSEMDAADLLVQTANNVTAILTRADAHLLTVVEPLAHFPILGNASALNGALSNLIANAVEAGAKKVVLKLEQEGDRVVFSVANDGPPIPEELKPKIFEPFFTSKSSGTGLGLAVVTAVTKVHQGIVSLGSWPDPFATVFTISLPLYVTQNAEPSAEVEEAVNAVVEAQDSQLLATAAASSITPDVADATPANAEAAPASAAAPVPDSQTTSWPETQDDLTHVAPVTPAELAADQDSFEHVVASLLSAVDPEGSAESKPPKQEPETSSAELLQAAAALSPDGASTTEATAPEATPQEDGAASTQEAALEKHEAQSLSTEQASDAESSATASTAAEAESVVHNPIATTISDDSSLPTEEELKLRASLAGAGDSLLKENSEVAPAVEHATQESAPEQAQSTASATTLQSTVPAYEAPEITNTAATSTGTTAPEATTSQSEDGAASLSAEDAAHVAATLHKKQRDAESHPKSEPETPAEQKVEAEPVAVSGATEAATEADDSIAEVSDAAADLAKAMRHMRQGGSQAKGQKEGHTTLAAAAASESQNKQPVATQSTVDGASSKDKDGAGAGTGGHFSGLDGILPEGLDVDSALAISELMSGSDHESEQMAARRARILMLQQKLSDSVDALSQVEKRLHESTLPASADDITPQEALAANDATSMAFAVYAQRFQQAQQAAAAEAVADMLLDLMDEVGGAKAQPAQSPASAAAPAAAHTPAQRAGAAQKAGPSQRDPREAARARVKVRPSVTASAQVPSPKTNSSGAGAAKVTANGGAKTRAGVRGGAAAPAPNMGAQSPAMGSAGVTAAQSSLVASGAGQTRAVREGEVKVRPSVRKGVLPRSSAAVAQPNAGVAQRVPETRTSSAPKGRNQNPALSATAAANAAAATAAQVAAHVRSHASEGMRVIGRDRRGFKQVEIELPRSNHKH